MKRAGRQRVITWLVRYRAARILNDGDTVDDILGWLEAQDPDWFELIENLTAQLPPRRGATP